MRQRTKVSVGQNQADRVFTREGEGRKMDPFRCAECIVNLQVALNQSKKEIIAESRSHTQKTTLLTTFSVGGHLLPLGGSTDSQTPPLSNVMRE